MFTHEAVREWEARDAPLLANQLRVKRRGQVSRSWHVDETYVRSTVLWLSCFESASRFCRASHELWQFERHRRARVEAILLAERRQQFLDGTAVLQAMLLAA